MEITPKQRSFLNSAEIIVCLLLLVDKGYAQDSSTVSTQPAADISGKWVGSIQASFGEMEFYFEFKMDKDGTLHGVHHGNDGDNPIQGKVVGTTLTFTEEREMFGAIRKMETKGEIIGDQIKLSQSPPKFPGGGPVGTGVPPSPDGSGTPPTAAAQTATDGLPMPPGASPGTGPPMPPPGAFRFSPIMLHRGEPAPSFRAGPIDYKDLPKADLPALGVLPPNGLAKTPPMGWNSWNKFRTKIDDRTVRGIADAIASNGMKEAGYEYIVIDDGWEWRRDQEGKIVPNPKFSDMKALADYVHSKGLKLGIYSSPGPRTCGGYEGSYGHEEKDAQSYAAWGIDYLKYDWCSGSRAYREKDMQAAYQKMGEALQKTGRPIVYALCQYGRDHVEQWGPSVGANLWRTTGDITDRYQSMLRNASAEAQLGAFAAPGHWNDPDMLEIGNGGMSAAEYRYHFSLWAILAAPLLAGNDVRTLTDETRNILLNKEVIAIDQDQLGKQGFRISQEGSAEIWARQLQDGSYAVGLFNDSQTDQQISVSWPDLKLSNPKTIRDLWSHHDLPVSEPGFQATVPAHGVVMIRVR